MSFPDFELPQQDPCFFCEMLKNDGPGDFVEETDIAVARVNCVFRNKVATRFGLKWPPNSEQSGHLFRSESDRFLAAAETGGRHVPK